VGATADLTGVISRILIGEGLGEHFTYLTFYPDVAIAALAGGFAPGSAAAPVSALGTSPVESAAQRSAGVDGASGSGDHNFYRPSK